MNTTITYTLSDEEQCKLDEWLDYHKKIFGECGHLTYKLTPNGIDTSVMVYNHLSKCEINLTDEDTW